jgi:peptidoglycan/xylan/chitin deacetylase (PgdA/CDA1 family)
MICEMVIQNTFDYSSGKERKFVVTRRQFLIGCASTIAVISGTSYIPKYRDLVKSIPILLYHRVGPELDDYTVSPTRFEADMKTLSIKGYTCLSLQEVKQHLQDLSTPLPNKPIILTLDDGYLDNYNNVFPILQQYSMKASFYIITGMVGAENRLTASQIREMAAAGMDFGSHTVSHRFLASLTPTEMKTELTKSKFDLEQILGTSVDFIAYPGGSYNSDTIKIAKEAGYCGGFSTHYGLEMFNSPFEIKRIPVFHYDRSISYVMLRKGLLPNLLH